MSTEPLPICRVAELDQPDTERRWLVDQLWSRSAVGFVAGLPKLGKTWLALDLALSVATDTPCLDHYQVCEPGEVLIYLAEDHPPLVRQRLAGLCRHRGVHLEGVLLYAITASSLRLDLEEDRLRLTEAVARIQPRLLVLDPLVRLHRRDENHAGDVAELLDFLRQLQRTHDLAILVVHHMRKGGARRTGQALRGSGDFHAWTDSALYLHAPRGRLLLSPEHRAAPAPDPIPLRLCSSPDGTQTYLEVLTPEDRHQPLAQTPRPLADKLIDLLQSISRPLPRTEIRRRLCVNNQHLGQVLAELEARGLLTRSPQGWQRTASHTPSAP
jgi:hypothetical protein